MRPRNVLETQRREVARGEGSSFFREIIAELRRVTWPSREEATRLTAMVVAVATAMGLFLWLIDSVFNLFIRGFLLGGG